MKAGNILLGIAAGFTAGYAAYRAYEAVTMPRPQPVENADAGRYGRIRRTLMLAGIARSLAGTAAAAYGPLAGTMEASVRGLPVWLRAPVFALEGSLLEGGVNALTEYVESYALEQRYGMSEQPLASWISDKCKEELLGAGVTVVLTTGFAWIVRRFPQAWAMLASAGTLPLLVAANVIVPVFVMPMFNKYTPLEGPLEERLRKLATRYGVGDAQILRMDMSKQTKKANAFVTGIGGTHRIVVGDTLLEHFSDDEIEFVVAHELGHYVSGDTWRMIAAGQVTSTIVLMGAFETIRDHSPENSARATTLAQIAFWSTLLTQMVRPMLAAFSRSREWAADHFALQATATPAVGASAFRRLRDQNLAEDEQPWWFEMLFATHPSLRRRIRELDRATLRGSVG